MEVKNKGGRPRQGSAPKLSPMNMRTSPELREKIEEAADVNGRSLTQEVERRLITSFIFDDHYGGPHIHTLVALMGSTIRAIEEERGTNWREDEATWEAVKAASERLLRWHRPKPAPDLTWENLLAEVDKTRAAHQQAVEDLDKFRSGLGILSIQGKAFDSPFPSSVRTGLFGNGTVRMIDPRANLTPEEIAEEARLEAAEREAREQDRAAHDALMNYARPRMQSVEQAKAQGEQIADGQFSALAPHAK